MNILLLRNKSCDRRENEEYRIRKWIEDNGHNEVIDLPADLVIFTACVYTKDHEAIVKKHIDKIPDLKILGCWPGAEDPEKLFPGLHKIQNYHRGVWLQQGCLGKCSFCTCHHSKLRSRDPGLILTDVQKQWEHGVIPILLGHDTGAYGTDRSTTLRSLLNLLHRNKQGQVQLDCMGGHWFLQYHDILSAYLLDGFINRIAIGIQTFNRTLLQRLGRPDFDTVELARKIQHIAELKGANIFDIRMITWPDETETEYAFDRKMMHTYLNGIPFHVRCFGREARDFYVSLDWICEKCKMKKFDCICKHNRKGRTLW